jgi:predicted ABC-type sugar transport system permease subunit
MLNCPTPITQALGVILRDIDAGVINGALVDFYRVPNLIGRDLGRVTK